MYKYLPTLFLIAGVLVLGVLGARQSTAPGPAPDASDDRPSPERAVRSVSPRPPPPSDAPARAARRVVRFTRPEPDPLPRADDAPADPVPATPSRPSARSLDDLPDAVREEVRDDALAALDELVDACGPTVPEGAAAMASIVLDDRGLLTFDVEGYDSAPGDPLEPSVDALPMALEGCLRDTLWSLSWSPPSDGGAVAFALSMELRPAE
jgi:hypothetical protein